MGGIAEGFRFPDSALVMETLPSGDPVEAPNLAALQIGKGC